MAQAGFYQPDRYDDPGDPHLGSQEIRLEAFYGRQFADQGLAGSDNGSTYSLAYRHSVLIAPFASLQGRVSRVSAGLKGGDGQGYNQTSYLLELGAGMQLPWVRAYAFASPLATTRVRPRVPPFSRSAARYSQLAAGIEGLLPIDKKFNTHPSTPHGRDDLSLWLGLGVELRRMRLRNTGALPFLPSEVNGTAVLATLNIYYMVGL